MIKCRYPDCFLAYQPVVNYRGGGILFYEALFRSGGTEPTQDLCIRAEEEGWITEIDLFALITVQALLLSRPDIAVSVNISAASIIRCSAEILTRLEHQRALCERLYVEITESHQVELASLECFVRSCKKLGVKIAQDDYGSGYSNETRARSIRPEVLKIVAPLKLDTLEVWAQNQLAQVITLAREIEAMVLVERIESQAAEMVVLSYGATAGQGYAYGKPARTV